MSSGHHNDDHSTEQKPISFTVPFFLATAFIILVVMFLSLCDPKPHHAGIEGHGEEHGGPAKTEHHDAAATSEHNEQPAHASVTESNDSLPVETTAPSAEPAHH